MQEDKYILLVSAFAGELDSDNNSRTKSIFSNIDNETNEVQLITTDFGHSKKAYKKINRENKRVICLHVPPYKKNLSINRLISHFVFAVKLKNYLYSMKNRPNAIYCSMPTSTSAYVCGKFCKENGVKFIVDVIDLWPDSLFALLPFKRILSILTFPWKKITIKAYQMADVIIGESKAYALEAAKYNMEAPAYPLYIGVDKAFINQQILKSSIYLNKPINEIWIAYGGSLGTSYDFETLIKGVASLNGRFKYKLWFIGDGVCKEIIQRLLDKYQVNAQITGFVSYSDYLKYLSYMDIAVNIFRSKTKVVHSYKFNDYVATNCFILNSLKGETTDMIDTYKIGLNFDFESNSLDKVLNKCVSNWGTYEKWRNNNKLLIDEVLDKNKIYSKINKLLTD